MTASDLFPTVLGASIGLLILAWLMFLIAGVSGIHTRTAVSTMLFAAIFASLGAANAGFALYIDSRVAIEYGPLHDVVILVSAVFALNLLSIVIAVILFCGLYSQRRRMTQAALREEI